MPYAVQTCPDDVDRLNALLVGRNCAEAGPRGWHSERSAKE